VKNYDVKVFENNFKKGISIIWSVVHDQYSIGSTNSGMGVN